MPELDFAERIWIRSAYRTRVVAPAGLGSNQKENCGICFVPLLPKQSRSPIAAQRNDRISYFAVDSGAPIPLQGLRSSLLFPNFSNRGDSFQEFSVALVLG
jgi:hypothetical protein